MDKTKYNWVLFSYNGNETVARLIINTNMQQLADFMDQGGNADDSPKWLFAGSTDCTAVCVGQGNLLQLRQGRHLIYVDNGYQSIADLPGWYVSYDDYPDGKIVQDVLGNGENGRLPDER